MASPPLIPSAVNKIAKREATEAETIPLGAIQATKHFCCQVKPLFKVQSRTLIGRTTNIRVKTVKTLPQPRATILARERSAASRIKRTETQRMVSLPLKRRRSRSSGRAEELRNIPVATVAIKPDSLINNWAPPNTPHTPAKTTRLLISSDKKVARFRKKLINQPPKIPIPSPIPKRSKRPVKISMTSASTVTLVLKMVSRTTTARMAPTGSMSTPSPSKMVATERST